MYKLQMISPSDVKWYVKVKWYSPSDAGLLLFG